MKKQYIYVTGSRETNIYKIGLSNYPEQRVQAVYNGSNQKHDYTLILEVENMTLSEKSLHLKFKANKIKGEWFTLSAEDIAWIEENAATYFHDSFGFRLNRKLKLGLNPAEMDLLELIVAALYPNPIEFKIYNESKLCQKLNQDPENFKDFMQKIYKKGILWKISHNESLMLNPHINKNYIMSRSSKRLFQVYAV